MSMNGNPHYDTAVFASELVPSNEEPAWDAATAGAIATLALAYEQRTANLLSFERSQWEAWKANDLTDDGQKLWAKAAEKITGRLGL